MEQEFSLLDYYTPSKKKNIVLSYKGPVTDSLIAEMGQDVRNLFAEERQIKRKIFAIFIELAQNILYYSAERTKYQDKQDSLGALLITREEEHYVLSCGNLIENDDKSSLSKRCKKINSLTRDDLRSYKREERSMPRSAKSRGAGIGLIQVALLSENQLSSSFIEVSSSYAYFTLSIRINRPKIISQPSENHINQA